MVYGKLLAIIRHDVENNSLSQACRRYEVLSEVELVPIFLRLNWMIGTV
jgi:hypothetical protein